MTLETEQKDKEQVRKPQKRNYKRYGQKLYLFFVSIRDSPQLSQWDIMGHPFNTMKIINLTIY